MERTTENKWRMPFSTQSISDRKRFDNVCVHCVIRTKQLDSLLLCRLWSIFNIAQKWKISLSVCLWLAEKKWYVSSDIRFSQFASVCRKSCDFMPTQLIFHQIISLLPRKNKSFVSICNNSQVLLFRVWHYVRAHSIYFREMQAIFIRCEGIHFKLTLSRLHYSTVK